MNVQASNGTQSNTQSGAKAFLSAADLTGLEGRLVKLSSASGVAKVALPAAVTDITPFVLGSGDVVGKDNYVEQPPVGGNFRAKLNGTCVPGDILILSDPTASSGANAGKVEALASQSAGTYYSPGVAEETGADTQLVLIRPQPRLISVKPTLTQNAVTDSTGGTAATPSAGTRTIAAIAAASTDTSAAKLTDTKNAFAGILAELTLIKADIAALKSAVV